MNKLLLALLLIPGIAGASINRVENNLVTTGKIANGSVTTPKLHAEALIDVNKQGAFSKLGLGIAQPPRMFSINGAGSQPFVHFINTTSGLLSSDGGYITYDGTDMVAGCQESDCGFNFFAANNSALNLKLDGNGNVGIGTASPAVPLDINADSVRVRTAQSPASNAACSAGEIAWDASYIYICTASAVWKRSALTGGY